MDKNNIKDKTFAGRFLVGARIGSGSFGEVFLVNLLETGELYAMKNVSIEWFSKIKKQNIHNL